MICDVCGQPLDPDDYHTPHRSGCPGPPTTDCTCDIQVCPSCCPDCRPCRYCDGTGLYPPPGAGVGVVPVACPAGCEVR